MTQREIDFCNRCPSNYTCGYLNRNLRNDCPRLNDYQDGYEEGREDTISKAEKWFEDYLKGMNASTIYLEDFRKYIKESV